MANHDLRQPLNSLGLFTSALDQHLNSPQARETARDIRESSTARQSMLDALIDLSRLDAGIVTVQTRNASVQAVVLEEFCQAGDPGMRPKPRARVGDRAAAETDRE